MGFELVKPVIDKAIQRLCIKPYYNHKNGCPNFGKATGCPPRTPLLGKMLDLSQPVWAVWVDFNLSDHRARMRAKHPKWSRRQLECCLYWQKTAENLLKHLVVNFCTEKLLFDQAKRRLDVLYRPEAYGVNVTATMKKIGIILEWPPVNIVRKIAFAGTPQSEKSDGD